MQRTHFTADYTLYNCVCDKKIIIYIYIYIYIYIFFFLQNRYPIMVKCLNIRNNIGKQVCQSISNIYNSQQLATGKLQLATNVANL